MSATNRYLSVFKPLALATSLATSISTYGAEAPVSNAVEKPWSVSLTAYMWMPGINGDISAGRVSRSVDASFLDIAGKLRNFPMAFNGHLEAHYEKMGFYMDGNYMGMDFRPRYDNVSQGLSMRMGIMEYGVMYRVLGSAAAKNIAHWDDKSKTSFNSLDLYAGGRTIWLGNEIQLTGPHNTSVSANTSLTAPLLGARATVDITPKWFLLMDGNGGGFNVDNISFTGTLLGEVGYRTRLFNVPTSVEVGYKALRVDVNKANVETKVTMNGPFIGLTGSW
jgi:hypothetical protein